MAVDRPLRILIDAAAARMGGAATHLPNFLQTAGRRFPGDTFIACVNSAWPAPPLPNNVRLRRIGQLRNRVAQIAWNQWGIARVAGREHADVLISLLNFGPVRCPIPHVVLERNPVYFCPFYLRRLTRTQAVATAAVRRLLHAVMRGSYRVVTPSAAMRDMIRTFFPDLPLTKFSVVRHGFSADTFRRQGPFPKEAAGRMAGSGGIRVLYVSHAASYKGIELLLEAARRLRDDLRVPATMWLTVAPEDWPRGYAQYRAFIARHGLQSQVRLLGRIPHDAVHRVYEAADIFAYPSFCESFGFPLVEAMASGLSIVAADLPLNREMCGEAASYYPPQDAGTLARELVRLAGDRQERARRAAAGRARARQFSWDDHVDAVVAIGREAVSRSSGNPNRPGPTSSGIRVST